MEPLDADSAPSDLLTKLHRQALTRDFTISGNCSSVGGFGGKGGGATREIPQFLLHSIKSKLNENV
jgi:hypothetical protein